MKLLYADTWMIDALKAANKTPAALLDLPSLLSTLSTEDVAFYLEVNKNLGSFLPKPLVDSFKTAEFKLQGWISEAQLQKVNDVLEARRLTNAKHAPADAKDEDKVLTVDILNEDTLLAHYIDRGDRPMDGDLDKAHWVSDFCERVLRQMATLVRFEAIAPRPIMRWYLEARQVILRPNSVV